MKTKIYITIDAEFSIFGAFNNPQLCKPLGRQRVLCEQDNASHGLGFLLDTLQKDNIKATFFIEALNKYYFGYEEMGGLVNNIVESGHDAQLHLHPCWTTFKNPNWQTLPKSEIASDDITQYTVNQMKDLIADGMESFSRWGVNPPIALRTGSLFASRNLYTAMAEAGIKYASNICVAINSPAEQELKLFNGCHPIGDCYELPVASFKDFELLSKPHYKGLTIIGSSWFEIKHLLNSATQLGIKHLVILTHPFEYIKTKSSVYSSFKINTLAKKRFLKLCQFLAENQDKFEVATFSELENLNIEKETAKRTNIEMTVPINLAIQRMAVNYLNDL